MNRDETIATYGLTDDERKKKAEEQAAAEHDYEQAREGIAELERRRSEAYTRAGRRRWEITQSLYIEDPIICEPHGFECVSEPPSVMSAGANIHIDDGKVCYAASIGRKSDFTDEELATYRRIKGRKR